MAIVGLPLAGGGQVGARAGASFPHVRRVPKWVQASRFLDRSQYDVIDAFLTEHPEQAEELQRRLEAGNREVERAEAARAEVVGPIARRKEARGEYEVFASGQRLPDGDPRFGEVITYGYEPDPNDGPDRVRVIRIVRGDDPEFDRLTGVLEQARSARLRELQTFLANVRLRAQEGRWTSY